jgi:hypothetical protein
MDKEIVNTAARKDFILDKLVPAVDIRKETGIDLRVSECLHSNTKCKTITDEISIFIGRHFSHLLAFLFFF